MIDGRQLLVWGFAALIGAGLGSVLLLMISAIGTRSAFDAYARTCQPGLSSFKRYRLYNDMLFNPDKYEAEFEADGTGHLDRFMKWRNRLMLGATGFATLMLGTWGLVGLVKFLSFVYVKGQQAG